MMHLRCMWRHEGSRNGQFRIKLRLGLTFSQSLDTYATLKGRFCKEKESVRREVCSTTTQRGPDVMIDGF